MQFILANALLLCVSISGIKSEAEPLTGTLGGHLASSGAYKDAHHEFIQAFHHGQHHGINGASESGPSPNTVGHAILNPQIQDQSAIVSQDQVSHSTVAAQQFGTPLVGGSGVIPQVGVSYVPQKSEIALHLAGRAIGSPSASQLPLPYYPYYGKTYASPYYSQYQPNPYQAVYPPPQSFYPYQYSPSPYSSPVTPYSAYPYNNYPYLTPQYYPGAYPSPSYYQTASGEIQTLSKQ